MLQVIINKLGWPQLKKDFLNYDLESFKGDLSAGVLVGAIAFPSVMAYAMLAGLNPIYGLYSFVIAAIVGTFVGVTRYIVLGPTSTVALIIAAALGGIAVDGPEKLEVVLLLTFMAGAIQIILSFLDFAKLAKYVSRSVISGLTIGIASIIVVGQLANILGVEITKRSSALLNLYQIGAHLAQINPLTFLVTVISLLSIVIVKNISPRVPAYLVGIVFSAIVVFTFGLESEIEMIQGLKGSLPSLSVPVFETGLALKVFSYSLAVAILGFIDALTLTEFRKEGAVKRKRVDKELCGIGVMNIACSFFSGFAGSASNSRSISSYETGKTRFAQLAAAIALLLFLIFFSGFAKFLPLATLGAILIIIAFEMVNWERVKELLKAGDFDTWIFIVTFGAVILIPRLDFAIYFSILFSLVLLLRDTSELDYQFLKIEGEQIERREPDEMKDEDRVIIDLEGELHFNRIAELKEKLELTFRSGNYFVIRMTNVNEIDMTTVGELEEFIDEVRDTGGDVFLTGIFEEIKEDFDDYGLTEKLGEDNFFSEGEELFESTREAIEKAKEENN